MFLKETIDVSYFSLVISRALNQPRHLCMCKKLHMHAVVVEPQGHC